MDPDLPPTGRLCLCLSRPNLHGHDWTDMRHVGTEAAGAATRPHQNWDENKKGGGFAAVVTRVSKVNY